MSSVLTPEELAAETDQLPSFKPELLSDLKLSGFEDEQLRKLLQADHVMKKSGNHTLTPILPLILSLKGRPFTLKRGEGAEAKHSPGYFPFETMYRTRMASKNLLISGRQVSKSTTLAAQGIMYSAMIPYFTTLFITPLFEMIRRFSQNYIGPFLNESPVRRLLTGGQQTGSVLQRSFTNNSKMIFSFALLDASRVRGVSCNRTIIDEIQDMSIDTLSIIRECMSGSPYGDLETFAGTPKSKENTIASLHKQTSKAEWAIKCQRCNYWNFPALDYDLEKMIGPWREDISFEKPALLCAKCRRPVHPHTGRWVHARPDKRWEFAGFHIPQMIMPMHYGNKQKWATLLAKQQGAGNTPKHVFENEVCGESSDSGSRLVTVSELQAASTLPWTRDFTDAMKHFDPSNYTHRVLGCDWGGGGQDEVSYTVYSVLGLLPSGKIDCIYAFRSLTPHDHPREARLALGFAHNFKCHAIAHDYTGAGSLRETLLVQAGYPVGHILPIAYVRVGQTARIMQMKPSSRANPRSYYQVDKTRSLLLVCNQIKNRWLRFFKYDDNGEGDEGLINDFVALVDEKTDSRMGRDLYTIIRDPDLRDDFAQATNIGCCALWHMSDKWPNVAEIEALRVPQALLDAMHPSHKGAAVDLL